MFAKRMPTFKLFLVVSTLVGFSSFILTPPTFAGNPGSSSTGSGSSGSSGGTSSGGSLPQCTHPAQQVDCEP